MCQLHVACERPNLRGRANVTIWTHGMLTLAVNGPAKWPEIFLTNGLDHI